MRPTKLTTTPSRHLVVTFCSDILCFYVPCNRIFYFHMCTVGNSMVARYRRGRMAYINYTSVPVTHSTNSCLSFYYYMSPGPVGSLAVYMTADGSVRRRVWERQANLGGTGISGRWLQAEIQLSADDFPITEVCTLCAINNVPICT